jgi:hypothetical protein
MKRKALIRHIELNGCEFYREGANHTLYKNANNKKSLNCSSSQGN